MFDSHAEFRQKLFNSQELSPALRASYEEELERMQNPKLVTRDVVIGLALVAILTLCTAGIVRSMLFFEVGALMLIGWGILAAAFSYAAYLIIRDIGRRKHSPKSAHSIAHTLTLAAGTITVVALLMGLQQPSDPASTFNALYVFVFYVACIAWSLESHINAAELAARERSLRLECRLADIIDRLSK